MKLFKKIIKFFKGEEKDIPLDSLVDSTRPRKLGEVPEMAITLGMIQPDHYKIYNLCNGNYDLSHISEEANLDLQHVKKIVQKLYRMALIDA